MLLKVHKVTDFFLVGIDLSISNNRGLDCSCHLMSTPPENREGKFLCILLSIAAMIIDL